MKILAIRGKNLASLGSPFEIDFRQEPLAGAGLFAISGPTGAGKSTLLDTLCLALYGLTPRLAQAAGSQIPDVLGEQVTPSDPRTLLRRGRGEGFAEVDFVGIDGAAYRARWSVRRARAKSDGKLQGAEYRLTRLADDQPVCGNLKSEVQGEILRLVGLSFGQFTRAVLLAQNDFAAFLKADDNERAELLQTLTGTDRFERISRRVYERSALERGRLEELERRRAGDPPLADEARAQLEQALAEARQAVEARERERADLEGAQRWHRELARLEQGRRQAGSDLARAEEARRAAAERGALLAQAEAVVPAGPLQRECERLEEEQGSAVPGVQALERSLTESKAAREAAETAAAAARGQWETAQDARRQAQPEIEAARVLDTEIATLAPQREAAGEALTEAIQTLERHTTDHARLTEQQARTAGAREESLAWLAGRAELEPLANHWSHWEYLLKEAEARQGALQKAEEALERLQHAAGAARTGEEEAGRLLARCETDRRQAEAEAERAKARCDAFDAEGLAGQKEVAEALRARLAEAQGAWSHWRERTRELAEGEADADAQRRLRQSAEAELQGLSQRRPGLEGRLAQAEQALRRAAAACNREVEGLRAGLAAGEPCPVCGAKEHPYARSGADHQLLELFKGYQADHAALRGELDALLVAESGQRAAIRLQSGRLTELDVRIKGLSDRREAAHRQWREIQAATRLGEAETLADALSGVEETAIDSWFVARRQAQEGEVQRLADLEKALRAAQKGHEAAQVRLDETRRAEQQALAARQEATEGWNRAAQALQAEQGRIAEIGNLLDGLLGQLEPVLAPLQQFLKGAGDTVDGGGWHGQPHPPLRGRAGERGLKQEFLQQLSEIPGSIPPTPTLPHKGGGSGPSEVTALPSDWRAIWRADPRSCREGHAQAVALWNSRQAQLAEQTRTLDALAGQIDKLLGLIGQAGEIVEGARGELARREAQLQAKREARREILGGRAASDVERELDARLKAAQSALADREQSAALAGTNLTQAVTTLELARTRLAQLEEAGRTARAERDRWLAGYNAEARIGLDIAGLQRLLGLDPAWLAQERAALAALDQAVENAAAVLRERQNQHAAHLAEREGETGGAGEGSEERLREIDRTLAELLPLLEREKRAAIEMELALRQDDDRRARILQLAEALRLQAATADTWAKLNDLIGSATGAKFRRIAQQYTLDVLLGYANRHLADLSPRYRLERLPDSLTLLVVDQDMGEERRSVHSLSGGESFLVSLALALGLASLSSHSVRVESLFIDEGFGSLDADTLNTALGALDNLQAQGRKVGVISHVQEMAERIGVRIQVKPESGGQSRLVVTG